MRGRSVRWGFVSALGLAVVTALAPVVWAAGDFSPVAGAWSGYNLEKVGSGYAFAFERNGAEYRGTLTLQGQDGQRRLVGAGRNANGPLTFLLAPGGGK